jgi:hypothetical protein
MSPRKNRRLKNHVAEGGAKNAPPLFFLSPRRHPRTSLWDEVLFNGVFKMLGNKKYGEAGKSIFMSSVTGLANTLALVATFIGAPALYGRSVGWVQSFTAQHYGYGWEDLTAFFWFIICAALVFFISRASVSTALVMGGLAIATRMF